MLISFKTSLALTFEINDNKETLTSEVDDKEENGLRLVYRELSIPFPRNTLRNSKKCSKEKLEVLNNFHFSGLRIVKSK